MKALMCSGSNSIAEVPKPRRRLKKMLGGDISVPVPRKNEDIKKSLKVRTHLLKRRVCS